MKETLKRSQTVAEKCNDKYAIVTYALAVAKISKQIHIQNSPKFDDCFVQFGQFHTILSLLSSIGKLLEGSGAAYRPSINKFLKRKPYNHCRRGNLLLAATHGLRFTEDINIPSTNLLQELENWANREDMSEVPSNL